MLIFSAMKQAMWKTKALAIGVELQGFIRTHNTTEKEFAQRAGLTIEELRAVLYGKEDMRLSLYCTIEATKKAYPTLNMVQDIKKFIGKLRGNKTYDVRYSHNTTADMHVVELPEKEYNKNSTMIRLVNYASRFSKRFGSALVFVSSADEYKAETWEYL